MPTEPSTSTSTSAGPAAKGSDWPAQATETIVGMVDTVKEKTTGPATTAVRGAVWGLLIAIVGTAALVLFLVLFVRGVDIGVQTALDGLNIEKPGRATWIAHTITGLVFLLPGVWFLRKGTRAAAA